MTSQNELTSKDVTNSQFSSQDLEQIKVEVNNSKRKLNKEYIELLKQQGVPLSAATFESQVNK